MKIKNRQEHVSPRLWRAWRPGAVLVGMRRGEALLADSLAAPRTLQGVPAYPDPPSRSTKAWGLRTRVHPGPCTRTNAHSSTTHHSQNARRPRCPSAGDSPQRGTATQGDTARPRKEWGSAGRGTGPPRHGLRGGGRGPGAGRASRAPRAGLGRRGRGHARLLLGGHHVPESTAVRAAPLCECSRNY